MPIQQGYEQRNGKRMGYYQWGESGKRYYYTPGNELGRKRARERAERQRAAAYASGYGGKS